MDRSPVPPSTVTAAFPARETRSLVRRAFDACTYGTAEAVSSVWRGVTTGYSDWIKAGPAEGESQQLSAISAPAKTHFYSTLTRRFRSTTQQQTTKPAPVSTSLPATTDTAPAATLTSARALYDFSGVESHTHDFTVSVLTWLEALCRPMASYVTISSSVPPTTKSRVTRRRTVLRTRNPPRHSHRSTRKTARTIARSRRTHTAPQAIPRATGQSTGLPTVDARSQPHPDLRSALSNWYRSRRTITSPQSASPPSDAK